MPSPVRKVAAAAAAALAVGSLTGCGLFEGPSSTDYTQIQLHPSGNLGAWLDPTYAAGLGQEWTVPGDLCGEAEGIIAVADYEDGAVVGYEARTGDEVWRVPETACDTYDVRGGHVVTVRTDDIGPAVIDIDIATGEDRVVHRLSSAGSDSQAIGQTAELTFIQVRHLWGGQLLALGSDAEVVWEYGFDQTHDCYLIEAHVVCELATGPFTVLDAATGEVTVSAPDLTGADKVLWTAGGYTMIDINSAPGTGETPIYDYTGTEIGTAIGADLPINPNLPEGVIYAVEDLEIQDAGMLLLTDAQGWGVAHWDQGMRLSETNAPLPSDVLLTTATADGSAVLFTDLSEDTVTLMGSDGETLDVLEDVSTHSLRVLAGLIVVSDGYATDATTTVHLPAG